MGLRRHLQFVAADLRMGLRHLSREPFSALTMVLALGTGIGLAYVGFATAEALLASRLPFANGDRFVRLEIVHARDRTPMRLDAGAYGALAQLPSIAELGAASGGRETAELPDGGAIDIAVNRVTPRLLAQTQAQPIHGRLLDSADGHAGAAAAALVSEGFWTRHLQRQWPDAHVRIANVPHAIVGVLPDEYRFPGSPDVWLALDDRFASGARVPDGDARLIGILAPSVTVDAAQVQIDALASTLGASAESQPSMTVTAFTDMGDMAVVLSTLIVTVVGAVLVVIAANVGNLVLARSFSRAREFSVRAALGATRTRLVMQVSVEVLALGLVAACLGGVAAHAVLGRFNTMDDIPFWVDFRGGPVTFILLAGATLLAATIAGGWPAWRATRKDVTAGLQGGGRMSDVHFGRIAGGMVVVQIAVSIVMLHGALVVAQGFRDYANPNVDLPSNVLTLGLGVNGARSTADGTRTPPLTADDALRAIEAVAGVQAVGAATALPRHSPPVARIEIEGVHGPARLASSAAVTPGFFDVMDAPAVAGRLLTAADGRPGAPRVAVINEIMAREQFGGSALGRRFRTTDASGTGPWIEVVGIVRDLGLHVADPSLAGGYYAPMPADVNTIYLAIRTAGAPLATSRAVRDALRARDAQVVPFGVARLEDVNAEDRVFFSGLSMALVGLGLVTLLLAMAGIYAMLALMVSRRTRDIGIRLALGASWRDVCVNVGGRTAVHLTLGTSIGVVLALLSLDARSVLVSRLGDGGPWTLPLVVGVLAAAASAATFTPLRRALGIRPQDALKSQ